METRFLEDRPCLVAGNSLVVGDLHNGIEHELFEKGVHVPSQTQPKLERLQQALAETKAKRLIILGDLKHNIPITSRQEYYEVPEFLNSLKSYVSEIILTKGNHDGGIENLLPPGITLEMEFIESGIGYFHGHTTPSEELLACNHIIKAHTHPAIRVADIKPYILPVWVETKLKENETYVTVIPTFDQNARGICLNVNGPVGPLMKNLADLDAAELFMLDGSYFGTLGELTGTR